MKFRAVAVAAVAFLGLAAPATVSFARDISASAERLPPASRYDDLTTGSLGTPERAFGCERSSASEGNANQQNFPVQQYGQTAGGPRC